MSRTRNALLITCVLVFSAIALAACGGDDSDEAGSDGSGDEATATAGSDGDTSEEADATTPAAVETADPSDGDDDSNGDAAVSDPCSLITKDEAGAALGESIQDPIQVYSGTANVNGTVPATVGTCNYVSPSGLNTASITVWSAPGQSDAMAQMVQAACANKEMISDLGDLACWYDDGHVEIQLAAGSVFLDIFVTTQGDSTEALLALSESAVGRVP